MKREEEEYRISLQGNPIQTKIASPATYSGAIWGIRVFRDNTENYIFKAGEIVIVRVYYKLNRQNGFGAWLKWHGKVEIYDDFNRLVGDDQTGFWTAPWTSLDSVPSNPWDSPMTIKFPMPNRSFTGYVRLLAGG